MTREEIDEYVKTKSNENGNSEERKYKIKTYRGTIWGINKDLSYVHFKEENSKKFFPLSAYVVCDSEKRSILESIHEKKQTCTIQVYEIPPRSSGDIYEWRDIKIVDIKEAETDYEFISRIYASEEMTEEDTNKALEAYMHLQGKISQRMCMDKLRSQYGKGRHNPTIAVHRDEALDIYNLLKIILPWDVSKSIETVHLPSITSASKPEGCQSSLNAFRDLINFDYYVSDGFDLDIPGIRLYLKDYHVGNERECELLLPYLTLFFKNMNATQSVLLIDKYGGAEHLLNKISEKVHVKTTSVDVSGFNTLEDLQGTPQIYSNSNSGAFFRALMKVGSNGIVFLKNVDQVKNEEVKDTISQMLESHKVYNECHEVEFNLSHVFFILSAKHGNLISENVRRACKSIEFSPYSHNELRQIAERIVMSKNEEYGTGYEFSRKALDDLIAKFARGDIKSIERVLSNIFSKLIFRGIKKRRISRLTPSCIPELANISKSIESKPNLQNELEEKYRLLRSTCYSEQVANRIEELYDSTNDDPERWKKLQLLINLASNSDTNVDNVTISSHLHLQRQIELALCALKAKKPVLFVGGPGTGKTSLAYSIAGALNQQVGTIQMNGETEVNFFNGSEKKAGKLILALSRNNSKGVLLLDELDKAGINILHELLDILENRFFHDEYTDTDIQLDTLKIIATANSLDNIPDYLLSRLSVVNFRGYTNAEKMDILQNMVSCCDKQIQFTEEDMKYFIKHFCTGPDIRNMKKLFDKLVQIVGDGKVTRKEMDRWLTTDDMDLESLEMNETGTVPGIIKGLGVTGTTGVVLEHQVAINKEDDSITGLVNGSMKEDFIRCKHVIEKHFGSAKNHFIYNVTPPAIPKDGTSAGAAIFCAMYSTITGVAVPGDIAITGEIDLNGTVSAVGGIVEKLIAAQNNEKIHRVFIPISNYQQLELSNEIVRFNELKIIPVRSCDEIIEKIFGKEVKAYE